MIKNSFIENGFLGEMLLVQLFIYMYVFLLYYIIGYVLNYINFMYEENVVIYIIYVLFLFMIKFCFNIG